MNATGISGSRRWARLSSAAALVAACLFLPAAARAMSAPAGAGNLSPRLAELATPSMRSLPPAVQAEQLSLPATGPASLQRRGNRVLVNVRFDSGAAAAVEALRAAGAEIVHTSRRYQTVTVAATPGSLRGVGDVAGVQSVTESLAPIAAASGCPAGAVTSEGDTQLNAASARAAFGVDGSGVTVGILSDSFDQDGGALTHAAGDVASGDLPGAGNPCGYTTPVNVLEDEAPDPEGEPPSDEGRAMAQIVHDLAPGSPLAFASAFNGELNFAANIRRLAAPVSAGGAGAAVIADDVTYFEEPFFQEGPVAVAADEVNAAGVSYFSAVGNDNLIDAKGDDIASWEAPEFRGTECPPALEAVEQTEDCVNFNPGGGTPDPTFWIEVEKGATLTVDLQWAEPWNGVATDLDAFLLNSKDEPLENENEKGEGVPVGSFEDNKKSQKPVEVFQWENETGASAKVELAINNCFGDPCNKEVTSPGTPRLKFALLEDGGGVTETEYPQSAGGDVVGPTVFGHAGAAGAIGVAAVPYDDAAQPEPYSSRGPVTDYFGPVSKAVAAPRISAQVTPKPDLAATDCVATTYFFQEEPSSPPPYRFCGTSAAAPHAAAVAALVREADPGASAAQVRADLTATALPVGAFGPDAVGAGLVDAYGAVAALALPPTITITQPPQPLSRNRQPTIRFAANRPVAFSCAVDGGAPQPCASPFMVPVALGDGRHGFVVTGVDQAGRVGTSAVASFTIDTHPPRTSIAKHPPKLLLTHRRTARATFRFRSNESDVRFVCKIDRGLPRFCQPTISRRFEVGRHTIQVRARDAAGNVDHSPAVFHFRVKRVG